MAKNYIVKKISEKWVKPSSPTPQSRKHYKLSSLDQVMDDLLMSLAFFYPKKSFRNYSRMAINELLETSLSKTLTYYYPFAGRLTDDNIYVDCNDSGVQLLEVEIQGLMCEIVEDDRTRDLVFPLEMYSYDSSSCHLIIQINYFQCGGIGIGICMSHKFGDGTTLSSFLLDWAGIARGTPDVPPLCPSFSGASIFPPSLIPSPKNTVSSIAGGKKKIISKRFVFSNSKISYLKKIATDNELDHYPRVENPSKVEVVTALIFKALIQMHTGPSSKPCLMSQAGNFRGLTIPPLSKNLVGNFVNIFLVTASDENKYDYKLTWLVEELRKSKVKFLEKHRKICDETLKLEVLKDWEEFIKKVESGRFETYVFTSRCRFPFYQIDFGWGKPKFVCNSGREALKNKIVLMDTRNGDGIEAFVKLQEDEMSIFERDQDLLAFASLNPPISWD